MPGWSGPGWPAPGWPAPGDWGYPGAPGPALSSGPPKFDRAPHPGPTDYPQLLRTPRARRWFPVAGVMVVAFSFMLIAAAVFALGAGAIALIDDPDIAEQADLENFRGPIGLLVGNLTIAAAILAAVLAVVLVHEERPGWLLSVRCRLRPALFGVAAGIAVVVNLVALGVAVGLEAAGVDLDVTEGEGGWPGTAMFVVLIAIVLLTTPLQAAGEEVVFRGYLVQALGILTRSSWAPALITSLLFAAAHGPQNPWLFADRFVFGLLAWWITVRTGGLEGAIALHVVNNVVVLVVAAAADEIDATVAVSDVGAAAVVLDVAVLAVAAVLIVRAAHRMGAQTRTSEPRPPAAA